MDLTTLNRPRAMNPGQAALSVSAGLITILLLLTLSGCSTGTPSTATPQHGTSPPTSESRRLPPPARCRVAESGNHASPPANRSRAICSTTSVSPRRGNIRGPSCSVASIGPTPAEFIFDVGLGDLFNARIAGNIADADLVGSMEFACQVSGTNWWSSWATPIAAPSKARAITYSSAISPACWTRSSPPSNGAGRARRTQLEEQGIRGGCGGGERPLDGGPHPGAEPDPAAPGRREQNQDCRLHFYPQPRNRPGSLAGA